MNPTPEHVISLFVGHHGPITLDFCKSIADSNDLAIANSKRFGLVLNHDFNLWLLAPVGNMPASVSINHQVIIHEATYENLVDFMSSQLKTA